MNTRISTHCFRVLHAPTTVGGNPQGQSKALNINGVDSISVAFSQNQFNYQADMILWGKNELKVIKFIKCLNFFLTALFHYDIFHFNFGRSLFGPVFVRSADKSFSTRLHFCIGKIILKAFEAIHYLELSLYHFFKKPIFMTYQGDDARQGDYCLDNFSITAATQVEPGYYDTFTDDQKRKSISLFARFCDRIYSLNPDLLWVLPSSAEFLPYSNVFIDEWKPIYSQMHEGPLRIAHAPTHRGVKGTKLILNALNELKRQGYEFELLLVEGLSNTEARKIYEKADILVDQIFVGWYGGIAVEAMALGKPVLVYIREGDLKFIPEKMKTDLPFIQITPQTVEKSLRQVLEMHREELLAMAHRSRAYVERWHDPIKIGERIKQDYEEALCKRSKTKQL